MEGEGGSERDGAKRGILTSSLLRALTLVSRFVLLFVVAKAFAPADAGQFGLISALAGYALFPLGLDFYTYSTREIVAGTAEHRRTVLASHLALVLRLYAVLFLPACAIAGALGTSPTAIALVGGIVAVEHASQELNRVLVALKRQVVASAVLFLRLGAWVALLAPVLVFVPEARKLNAILVAWLTGAALAILIGLRVLSTIVPQWWRAKPDWQLIRRGVAVALPFLFATLAWRGLFVADRWLVGLWHSPDVLGAYVLYAGVTGAVLALQDAAVLSFALPQLIGAARGRDSLRFQGQVDQLWKASGWLVLAFLIAAAMAWIFLIPLLPPTYATNREYAVMCAIAAIALALSMVPHSALYAADRDLPIIVLNITAAATLVPAAALSRLVGSTTPVAWGLLASSLVLLVGKTIALRSIRLC